ncbi:FAD-dependent oxidoreductase [Candidatus Poribacteria bacterium]|nr:FAD-dependent oxidoreductase [Candidatus Poribacteria bacterium]
MEEKVKVDLIVVGGGPAGLMAAAVAAKEGLDVVVVERGEYSGAKNVGGLLYGTILSELIPDFHERAPIERFVSKRILTFLTPDKHISLSFGSDEWAKPPFNNTYIVHRSQFDRWLAEEVEEMGATLLDGTVVDDLIYDEDKAIGVRIRGEEEEEFFSDVVILADGANPLVTESAVEKLGMRKGKKEQQYAIGVKEIIALPREKIEDRFNLDGNEGAALDFFGAPFEGLVGGGFIYTCKETLSIGVAAKLETMVQAKMNPNDLIEGFKRHPFVKKLIEGGELLEYSAHLIPEGGRKAVPQLSANGVMIVGDAAGFVNASLYKEGTNHAMESGRYAGLTAAEAKGKGDFSRQTLSEYERKLSQGVVMKDLEKYERFPEILDTTPEILSLYPKKIVDTMVSFFSVTGEPKSEIQKRAIKEFFRGLPKLKLIGHLLKAKKLI